MDALPTPVVKNTFVHLEDRDIPARPRANSDFSIKYNEDRSLADSRDALSWRTETSTDRSSEPDLEKSGRSEGQDSAAIVGDRDGEFPTESPAAADAAPTLVNQGPVASFPAEVHRTDDDIAMEQEVLVEWRDFVNQERDDAADNWRHAIDALQPFWWMYANVVIVYLWSQFLYNRHGTHFFQAAVEAANEWAKAACVDAMLPDLIEMSKHDFGNHAVTQLVKLVPVQALYKIIQVMSPRQTLMMMARHHRASRPLQHLLYRAQAIPGALDKIKQILIDAAPENATDQFFSKVLQSFIEALWWYDPQRVAELFWTLYSRLPHLATHAYGSWVVQKFLKYGSPEMRCASFHALQVNLKKLALGAGGGFVVDSMLECAELQHTVAWQLQPHLGRLRAANKGKMVDKVERLLVSYQLNRW